MHHAFPHDIEPYQAHAESDSLEEFVARFPNPFFLFARSRLWDATFLKARSVQDSGTVVLQGHDYETQGGLVLVSGVKKRQDIQTPSSGIILGRATDNDIVVPVASVSSIHARMSPPATQSGSWTITDLESSNHTFLNDAKIQPHSAMPVADGDFLRFGGNLLCWFITASRFHTMLRDPADLAHHTDP